MLKFHLHNNQHIGNLKNIRYPFLTIFKVKSNSKMTNKKRAKQNQELRRYNKINYDAKYFFLYDFGANYYQTCKNRDSWTDFSVDSVKICI